MDSKSRGEKTMKRETTIAIAGAFAEFSSKVLNALLSDAVDVVVPPVIDPPVEPPPVIPPVVTPPGSLIPFDLIPENMFTSTGGWFNSENLSTKNKAVLRVRLKTQVHFGYTVRLEYEQKTNIVFDGTKNIKDFRSWPADDNYPNDYTGRPIGSGAHCITAENGDGKVIYQKTTPGGVGWNVSYFTMPIKRDVVQRIVREFKYGRPGEPEGWARITVDGEKVFEGSNMVLPGSRRDFCPQMVYANPGTTGPLPSNAYYNARIISIGRIE
jgi:hypothetical protein